MNIIDILIGYGLGCVMGGGSLYAFQQEKIKELMKKHETTQISLYSTFEELKETKLTIKTQQAKIERLQGWNELTEAKWKELTESKEQEIKTLCESQQTQIFKLETDYQQQIKQLEENYQTQLLELQNSTKNNNWWRYLFTSNF